MKDDGGGEDKVRHGRKAANKGGKEGRREGWQKAEGRDGLWRRRREREEAVEDG